MLKSKATKAYKGDEDAERDALRRECEGQPLHQLVRLSTLKSQRVVYKPVRCSVPASTC
jgi:hypothetical protein